MITIKHPNALGWKHNHVPGISTKAGELVSWPTILGPMPTQAQVNQWEAEWLVFVNTPANFFTELRDIEKALITKGTLSKGDIDTAKSTRVN